MPMPEISCKDLITFATTLTAALAVFFTLQARVAVVEANVKILYDDFDKIEIRIEKRLDRIDENLEYLLKSR